MFSTNRSPAIANGDQNGIHHRRWVPRTYEQTNKIVMNKSASQFQFKLIITMLFSYGRGQQRINDDEKCRQIARDFDCHGDIAQCSTSRASLEATRCRHRQSACSVSPWQLPWSMNSNKTHKTQTKHNFQLATTVHFDRQLFMRISGPKTDPLFSSSMQQASFKCEMPRLEPKKSWTFLAIKRCQGTKSKKVIN